MYFILFLIVFNNFSINCFYFIMKKLKRERFNKIYWVREFRYLIIFVIFMLKCFCIFFIIYSCLFLKICVLVVYV